MITCVMTMLCVMQRVDVQLFSRHMPQLFFPDIFCLTNLLFHRRWKSLTLPTKISIQSSHIIKTQPFYLPPTHTRTKQLLLSLMPHRKCCGSITESSHSSMVLVSASTQQKAPHMLASLSHNHWISLDEVSYCAEHMVPWLVV